MVLFAGFKNEEAICEVVFLISFPVEAVKQQTTFLDKVGDIEFR